MSTLPISSTGISLSAPRNLGPWLRGTLCAHGATPNPIWGPPGGPTVALALHTPGGGGASRNAPSYRLVFNDSCARGRGGAPTGTRSGPGERDSWLSTGRGRGARESGQTRRREGPPHAPCSALVALTGPLARVADGVCGGRTTHVSSRRTSQPVSASCSAAVVWLCLQSYLPPS